MDKPPFIHRPLLRSSKKLTPAMAERAFELRKLGFTQHEIAAKLGLNQGRISELFNGHWKRPDDAPLLPGLR